MTAAKASFVKGDSDEGNLRNTVDNVIVHLGREVAREAIRKWLKEQPESDGKAKEAEKIIRERMIEKLRKKEAMDNKIERIASRIVASDVTATLISQIRHFLPSIKRAVIKVMMDHNWDFVGFKDDGKNTIFFNFGSRDESKNMDVIGAKVEYDEGMDTYIFTPYMQFYGGPVKFGEPVSDFYVEDFGDVSKLAYIFERLRKKVIPGGAEIRDDRTASETLRTVLAEYSTLGMDGQVKGDPRGN